MRVNIFNLRRQHGFDAVHHHIPALAMDIANPFEVGLKQPAIEEFSAKDLRDYIGVGVGGCFGIINLSNDAFVRIDIS